MNFLEEINRIDRRFFEKHQNLLLKVANSRLGRWYFRIQEHPISRQFFKIEPNALHWKQGGEMVAEFRTANRYANRLKTSFFLVKNLIKILTALGTRALIRAEEAAFWLSPVLLVGASGTFYPDANTESTSVDGNATRTPGGLGAGESWANLRTGAGTSSSDSSADELAIRWSADNVSNQWRIMTRGFFLFDTSSLTSGATISAATFSLYITILTAPTDATASKRELRVVSSNPASNTAIANSDYGTLGSTEFGHITYSGVTLNAYNDVSLNASGLSNISKTGVSKFGTLSGADMDNSAPTWASFDTLSYQIKFADASGTTTDPKLVVTYTIVTPTQITKSLQYCIRSTPSAITKSLQYYIRRTPSAITKSLQYEVTPSPATQVQITKSLQYCVRAAKSSLTKSLQYAVKNTPAAITKSLGYNVKITPSPITKSLQYVVKAPIQITKSLQYVVYVPPQALGFIRGTRKNTGVATGGKVEMRGNHTNTNIKTGQKL